MASDDLVRFHLIKRRLRSASRKLLRLDSKLFEFNVNERTLTQRLAHYLQPKFNCYKVDCEYNRNIEGEKTLPIPPRRVRSDDTNAVTVFPDLVVHERGIHAKNLLVIEAKKDASRNRVPRHDARKLAAFTSPEGNFKYRWGAFVNFFRERGTVSCDIRWFEVGRELSDEEVARASELSSGRTRQ